MDNLDHNQMPGGKKENDPEPSLRQRLEPIKIAGAVILLVLPIAWFAYDPGFDSLLAIITALFALFTISSIKNKKVNWLLAAALVVTAVVGFVIVSRENDPEKIAIIGIFNDGVKAQESDEYVMIRSEDTKAIQLEGWTLNDAGPNHVFTFPKYEIQPGQECRVYTNEYHPESCGFSFRLGGTGVWNNDEDKASLRNAEGKLIDESSELITSDQVANLPSSLDIAAIPTPTLSSEYDDLDCIPRDTPREVGLVVRVTDGRTIDVQRRDGSIVRVRYLGVATIVEGQPLFERSVEVNRELVLGKEVTLVEDTEETGMDDILMRYVFVGDTFINRELIASGYAAATGDSSCVDHFINMNMAAAESDSGFYRTDIDVEMYGDPFFDTPPEDDSKSSTLTLGDIVITDIFYDGVKSKQEPDEYVEIRNEGAESVQLNGWTLSDKSNHTFVFPSFIIEPGHSCRIYTNEDHYESCGFNYENTETAIWGNKGDCATLRDPENSLIDEYCY